METSKRYNFRCSHAFLSPSILLKFLSSAEDICSRKLPFPERALQPKRAQCLQRTFAGKSSAIGSQATNEIRKRKSEVSIRRRAGWLVPPCMSTNEIRKRKSEDSIWRRAGWFPQTGSHRYERRFRHMLIHFDTN